MNRNLEQAFAEQAGQLFTKCRAYIGIDEDMPPEAKEALKEEIAAAWEALDVDLMQLYEEIAANLEEPMSEQQRERYCFSLITPFKEYSSVLFPVWEIAKYQESLARAQSEGNVNLAELYTNLIVAAEARAERYKKMAFAGKYKPVDEAEKVYRKLAQMIGAYGRILDAAFVLSGLDLKRLQDRCAVWVNDFSIPDRARQIGEIIGSDALANEYLAKLQQEQREQLQDVTNSDSLAGVTPEPQHEEQEPQGEEEQGEQQNGVVHLPDVLNTQKTKAIFDEAIKRGWMQPNGKGGYEWLGLKEYKRGKQQQLVYMIGQMFGYKKSPSGNNGNNIPSEALESLFGVSGIYSRLIKCWEAKPQAWRPPIDDMIVTALKNMTTSTSN